MALSEQEIFDKIHGLLIDALGVDDDEITREARLGPDLGAESIDYLDISFRLEKAFDIKIEQSEMFPDNVLSDPQYIQDGKVTDSGMAELRKRLTHANLDEFDKSRKIEDFANVFTVGSLVKFVQNKVA